jgi:hypothetical protein
LAYSKPNPYLADTVAHLMSICSGEAPGFIPARDNTAAPIRALQRVFVEDYRLKKYPPVIMHPHHFSLEEKTPVYYSFEIPTTMRFSPKSNNALTTMTETKGIKHITEVVFVIIFSVRYYAHAWLGIWVFITPVTSYAY